MSILDERLAEIDRRLRSIQSGLEPADSPVPPTPLRPAPDPVDPIDDPGAAPADTAPANAADDPPSLAVPTLVDDLRELSAAHARLLELHRELLAQYAELLEARAGEATAVPLTAGPFRSADGVHDFERAVATLPGVTGVAVREYLGGDRVSLEVTLAG